MELPTLAPNGAFYVLRQSIATLDGPFPTSNIVKSEQIRTLLTLQVLQAQLFEDLSIQSSFWMCLNSINYL